MKNERKHYPYHDEFVEMIKKLDCEAETIHTPSNTVTPQRILETIDKMETQFPEVPEPILKHRYQKITRLARDLACCTTSNLTVELRQGYRLFLQYEGDVFMIHDRSVILSFLKLLDECDSFHIFPKDNLFQLLISYDLRLLER